MFVLGVSSWYLLKARDTAFAMRSFAVAAGFGLASVLSVIVLGDESGYSAGEVQRVKLAAIESEWETQAPPAAFTAFGIPNDKEERTDLQVRIPYVLGLMATRSFDREVTGLKDLKKEHEARIRNGMVAYEALVKLKAGDRSLDTQRAFELTKPDLGYALLLKKYTPNVVDATPEQIRSAASDTIPKVAPLFWSFRVMVGLAFLMLFIFAASFWFMARKQLAPQRWLLKLALWAIPVPWIASELGWFVAEYGRQPWTISGVLPTHLSASSLEPGQIYFSLAGFIVFYTLLLVVELFLMFKYARLGPSSLHTGRYHHEHVAPQGAN
jgi:cytochrome d ubiquinol oxidase subunit I